jgi:small-conductance mechanosensitive channel
VANGEVGFRYFRAVVKLIILIILFVVANALLITWFMSQFLPSIGLPGARDYVVYVSVALTLVLGYLIVGAFADVIYWSLRLRYDHGTARAVRNVFFLVGIGALIAGIAGAVGGGVAGVAVGGFLGIVIGFATQQVLSQAVAGLFLLISRPFRIGSYVNLLGEEGRVEDVAVLFTEVVRSDGTRVLIPNGSIIGNKIYILKDQ